MINILKIALTSLSFPFKKINKLKLCLISFLIFTKSSFALCDCSDTSMYVAQASMKAFISANMSEVRSKVKDIVSFYRSKIEKQNEKRNRLIKQNLELDIKINLLLKEYETLVSKEEFHEFIKSNKIKLSTKGKF